MQKLKALEKGARFYRAAQGAKWPVRKKLAQELLTDGIFSLTEVSMICNLHRRTIKRYPEYKVHGSKRLVNKFNPGSLDLLHTVRRKLINIEDVHNGHLLTLVNDGNGLLVISFWLDISMDTIRRRTSGQITSEWFNHKRRLGGARAWETRKQRGTDRSSYRPNGGRPITTKNSDSPGLW